MASRIRNGRRLPGVLTMRRIHSELGIPYAELVEAYHRGARAFGKLVSAALDDELERLAA